MKRIHERPTSKAAFVFLALILTLVHCTKPEQELGIDLQDEDQLFAVFGVDTFTLKAYTLPEDSIRSDKFTPATIGAYVDPIFGFAKAEHITELRLSSSNPIFAQSGTGFSDLVIDSLVLTLSFYSNISQLKGDAGYGNFGPQYFKVFEITDSLTIEGQYYSNREVNYIPQDMVLPGQNYVTPRPFDSTLVGGAVALPQIRLPLRTEMAERIMSINNGNGLTQAEFLEAFKGIYITVDETQFNPFASGILYFDTFLQLSRISAFYRNPALNDTTLLRYDFWLRNNSGKFSRFQQDHSYGAPTLSAQVVQGIKDPGQRDLYIQAMGGTKVRVDIPHINELRNVQGQAISRAALTVPVRMENIGIFPPQEDLFIFGIREDGSAILLPDQLEGVGFIGGRFDPEKGHYRFLITRYLQQIVNGTADFYGLEIVSTRAAFSANRVVLNGPEYPDPATPENNMKLQMIFTKF